MLLLVFQWTWNDFAQFDSLHKSTVSKQIRKTTVKQEALKPGNVTPHFLTTAILIRDLRHTNIHHAQF